MGGCVAGNDLLDYVEGRAFPDDLAEVEAHLRCCDGCRRLLAEVARPPWPETYNRQGERVGRYEILAPIGAGGMGVVYAAHDPQLDRKVALKMLRPSGLPGVSPQQLRARILREGRAMALLSHPNVLAVYDVGEFQDQVFVAMEIAEGGTVASWLREEPRSWREVLDVFLAAGRGLAAAHAKGLVHRDFKPENILFGRDGRVRVTDFGVAELLAAPRSASMTAGPPDAGRPTVSLRSSAVVGSPAYMAPEQMRGEQADVRADVFSYCVSLYEALYGERPFAGETVADLQRAVSESEVRRPPSGSRVPAWIRRALLHGLRAEPGERPQMMEALIASLSKPRPLWGPHAVVPTIALLSVQEHELKAVIAGCEDAINREDFDALMEFYTDDATLVVIPGKVLTGKPQIREAFDAIAAHFNHTLHVSNGEIIVFESGDTALVLSNTHLRANQGTDSELNIDRRGTYIFKKLPDEKWRCVIDNSYGTDLLPPAQAA